ncbi:MAG: exodeoxyribonuclease VII small subunit [Actinomycetota bacterium]|jgi:exodeoxyribonuclease VII small subunit|nr:exodeoxyribonuclease VII small subunit [Actinomycetota bacterium]
MSGTGKKGVEPERASAPAVKDMSYTEASHELGEIVSFFEQQEVDVDQIVERMERATAIVGELEERLRRTRAQVETLVPRLSAAISGQERSDAAPTRRIRGGTDGGNGDPGGNGDGDSGGKVGSPDPDEGGSASGRLGDW